MLLAFETMEKIVREYFPYITETEALTFTDCVKCLITFTNSRFNSDVSLNAIAFLRFCAVKLAEGALVINEKTKVDSSIAVTNEEAPHVQTFGDKEDNVSFWVPLLTGDWLLNFLLSKIPQLLTLCIVNGRTHQTYLFRFVHLSSIMLKQKIRFHCLGL